MKKREYRLLMDLSWLPLREDWVGLLAVGMATATVTATKGEKTSVDTRYFLSSVNDVERFAYAVCKHWAIENQSYWCPDVIFDEDSSRARKDISPLNLNILRKTALTLCKNADVGSRVSIQKKRFIFALNPKKFPLKQLDGSVAKRCRA